MGGVIFLCKAYARHPAEALLARVPESVPSWAVSIMKSGARRLASPRDVTSHSLKVLYPGGANRVSLVTHVSG